MKRLTGPTATVRDQRDALDKLEGLPKKDENIGSAIAHLVPDVYEPGALGWIAHLVELVEHEDPETFEMTGEAHIDVEDALITEHDGESVDLDGRTVVVDFSAATDV